jgi:hypothetical protein
MEAGSRRAWRVVWRLVASIRSTAYRRVTERITRQKQNASAMVMHRAGALIYSRFGDYLLGVITILSISTAVSKILSPTSVAQNSTSTCLRFLNSATVPVCLPCSCVIPAMPPSPRLTITNHPNLCASLLTTSGRRDRRRPRLPKELHLLPGFLPRPPQAFHPPSRSHLRPRPRLPQALHLLLEFLLHPRLPRLFHLPSWAHLRPHLPHRFGISQMEPSRLR